MATNTTLDSVEKSRLESKLKACRAQESRVPGDVGFLEELLNIRTGRRRSTKGHTADAAVGTTMGATEY